MLSTLPAADIGNYRIKASLISLNKNFTLKYLLKFVYKSTKAKLKLYYFPDSILKS